jgi:hypothetical protein
VAFLWAESLRDRKVRVDDSMLARLQEASRDFKHCRRTFGSIGFSHDRELKEYHAFRDSVRAMITLAEVELDLSLREPAARHIRESTDMLGPLLKRIEGMRAHGLIVPAADRLTSRLDKLRAQTSGGAASSLAPRAMSRSSIPSTDQKLATAEPMR